MAVCMLLDIADELKAAAQSYTYYTIRDHLYDHMQRTGLSIEMMDGVDYCDLVPWHLSFLFDWLSNASDASERSITEITDIVSDDVRFITRFLLAHTSKSLSFSNNGLSITDSDLTAITAWLQQDQNRCISLIPSAVDMEADVFPLPVGELVISGHISRAEAVKLVASITGPVKMIQVQYTYMDEPPNDPGRLQYGALDISSLVGPDTSIHAYRPVVIGRLKELNFDADTTFRYQFAISELHLYQNCHVAIPPVLAQSTIDCRCEIVRIGFAPNVVPSRDRQILARMLHRTQCLHIQLEDHMLPNLEETHCHVRVLTIRLTRSCVPHGHAYVIALLQAARARFPRLCHVCIRKGYDPSLATLIGYHSMGAECPYYTTANDRKPLMDSIKWFYKSYQYHHHNDAWRDMLLLIWHLVYAASMASVPTGACAIPAGVWPHLLKAFYLTSCQQLLGEGRIKC